MSMLHNEAMSSSLILSPALAGILGSNHGLHVRDSPLPEGLGSHVASACAHFSEHLGASACACIRRGQTEVTRHSGSASQQLVELVLGDTALALFISLNEAI